MAPTATDGDMISESSQTVPMTSELMLPKSAALAPPTPLTSMSSAPILPATNRVYILLNGEMSMDIVAATMKHCDGVLMEAMAQGGCQQINRCLQTLLTVALV